MAALILAGFFLPADFHFGPHRTNTTIHARNAFPSNSPPVSSITVAIAIIILVTVFLSILAAWLTISHSRRRSSRSGAPKISLQEWIGSSRDNREHSGTRNSYRGVDHGSPSSNRVYTNTLGFFGGAQDAGLELCALPQRGISKTTRIVWEETWRKESRMAGNAERPWGVETVVRGGSSG